MALFVIMSVSGASLPGKLRRKYGEKLREDNEFEFTEASQKVKKTKKAKSKETKQSHQVENDYIYSYQYELQSDDSLSVWKHEKNSFAIHF